jgi:hypothetical protein
MCALALAAGLAGAWLVPGRRAPTTITTALAPSRG